LSQSSDIPGPQSIVSTRSWGPTLSMGFRSYGTNEGRLRAHMGIVGVNAGNRIRKRTYERKSAGSRTGIVWHLTPSIGYLSIVGHWQLVVGRWSLVVGPH
jgi:hypothetical protein